jgi:hypothetical protein
MSHGRVGNKLPPQTRSRFGAGTRCNGTHLCELARLGSRQSTPRSCMMLFVDLRPSLSHVNKLALIHICQLFLGAGNMLAAWQSRSHITAQLSSNAH